MGACREPENGAAWIGGRSQRPLVQNIVSVRRVMLSAEKLWVDERRLRLCIYASLSVVLVIMLLASAPALAAGSPLVEGESFREVLAYGATLTATVNPDGSPVEYRFEYGTSTSYGSSTPSTSLDAKETGIAVSASLSDALQPETTYHFRVVATNSAGESAYGADMTFTTFPSGPFALPDERVFEMVTPPNNENANVYVPEAEEEDVAESHHTQRPFQVAVNGDAVAYVADPTAGGGGQEGDGYLGAEYLATRSPEGGWSQSNILPENAGFQGGYEGFSPSLSVGILYAEPGARFPTLSPEAPPHTRELYTRTNADGSVEPFFTVTPPYRSGEAFKSYQVAETGAASEVLAYGGSSANYADSLFEADEKLTPEAPGGTGEDPRTGREYGEENNLYDSEGGRLSLINVLPDGVPEDNATFGAPPLNEPFDNPPDFSHAISTSGSRVFWTDLNDDVLYAREAPTSPNASTVELDANEGGAGSSGGGRFWTASSEGTLVFFTDEKRLTSNSTAGQGAPDLYEYDFEKPVGERLTDLTADLGGAADVQGVLGASENGSYVYFVAGGALAGGASSQTCEPGGRCNLYVLQLGQAPKLVATLSYADGGDVLPYATSVSLTTEYGPIGDWQPGLGRRTSEVTPDGGALVFMSEEGLTGEQAGHDEVYVYDAETSSLACASCDPTGEHGSIGYVPISWSNTEQLRFVSEEGGRVFFDATGPLAAQSTDGKQNVYEWERDGLGTCQSSGGCVFLISGGNSPTASWLIGASGSGDDVFFATRAKLVQQDGNELFDLYDARVDGVQPISAPSCTGTGCQGVAALPPIFATPASATFDGVGNFAPSNLRATKSAKHKTLTRAKKLVRALRACAKRRSKQAQHACRVRAHKRYRVKAKKPSAKKRSAR